MKPLAILKRPLIWILTQLDLYGLVSLKRSGPLVEDGWFRSNREQASVDATGAPLPWITYPAIEFIRKRLRPEMSVFEYGSGGSTMWWANLVKEVVSVEHDQTWFHKIRENGRLLSNVTLHWNELIYGGDYSKKILDYKNRFDIVVIDGRDRVNCVKNCLSALKAAGVVILDNSDRPQYREAECFLIANGFKRIEFVGFCPIVNVKSETAIFYRLDNVFGI